MENTNTELIPNLTRKDIHPGTQRAQVSLTQFLYQLHSDRHPGDVRLESCIHAMALAFRMQSAATDVYDLSSEPQQIHEL